MMYDSGDVGSNPWYVSLFPSSSSSTEFSRFATSKLACDFESPSVNVSAPYALDDSLAFVCIEMNRSPSAWLAMFGRSCSVTYLSVLRVYTIFTSGYFSVISSPTARAMVRFMSFSCPILPTAPGSFPPWPGSSTTVNCFADSVIANIVQSISVMWVLFFMFLWVYKYFAKLLKKSGNSKCYFCYFIYNVC